MYLKPAIDAAIVPAVKTDNVPKAILPFLFNLNSLGGVVKVLPLFSLTNIYDIQPTKFASRNSGNEVYIHPEYGPCFYDTWNYTDFVNNSEAYFGDRYQDTTGKGNSMFTGNTDNNNRKITLNEVEVFKLYQ